MSRIPCLVMSHGLDEINSESLTSIISCDPRLDIDVIHNPWPDETGEFLAFAKERCRSGAVASVLRYDENISNNACHTALRHRREQYSASPFLIVTDCDVLAPPGVIDEQIAILERHDDVFACGLRVDATRWPDSLEVKAELVERFNTSKFETEDYLRADTGVWMAMFRAAELYSVLDLMEANGKRFTDGSLKMFASILLGKSWAATKHAMGRELNRERTDYRARKAISTERFGDFSPEGPTSKYAVWNHSLVCSGELMTAKGEQRIDFPPLPPATPRFRGSLEQDPAVVAIRNGAIEARQGYLRKHVSLTETGQLSIAVRGARPISGLPALPGGKAAVFLSHEAEAGPAVAALDSLDIGKTLIFLPREQARNVLITAMRFVGPNGSITGDALDSSAMEGILDRADSKVLDTVMRAFKMDRTQVTDTSSRVEAVRASAQRTLSGAEIEALARELGYGHKVLRSGDVGRGHFTLRYRLTIPAHGQGTIATSAAQQSPKVRAGAPAQPAEMAVLGTRPRAVEAQDTILSLERDRTRAQLEQVPSRPARRHWWPWRRS